MAQHGHKLSVAKKNCVKIPYVATTCLIHLQIYQLEAQGNTLVLDKGAEPMCSHAHRFQVINP